MSSHISLTQSQIHDLFQLCETRKTDLRSLEIPSFGDAHSSEQSPEFQHEGYYFESDKKDDNCTTNPTNHTNRHPSQDSILERDDYVRISKVELDNLKSDAQKYRQLTKFSQEVQKHKQMVGQVNSYKSQLYVFQECNKKLQKHIYDLLQDIKKLESENQTFQEDLLQLRLQMQDQLKIIQQGKIDIERLKINMIEKDERYHNLKDEFDKLLRDSERSKNCKSVQRSTYISKNSPPLYRGLSRCNLNPYCNSSLVDSK